MGSLNPFAKPKSKEVSSSPTWVTEAGKSALKRGEEVSNTPYTPYGGSRVAGLTTNLGDASKVAQNSRGNVFRNEYFQPAQDLIKSNKYTAQNVDTRAFGGDVLEQYMNPYIKSALDPVTRELREEGERTQQRLGKQAGMRGAFGGARQGILESEARKGTEEAVGDVYSRGYDTAFGRATDLFTSDEARKLNAGQFNEGQRLKQAQSATEQGRALGNLGTQFSGIKNDVTDRLLRTGGVEQQYQQSLADEEYRKFAEERDDPERRLDILLKTLNAARGAGGQATHVEQPNKWNQAMSTIGNTANAVGEVMTLGKKPG